jgi:hypothetical protein
MRLFHLLLLPLLVTIPLAAQKQLTGDELDRRMAAHEHDFDYLLGDWQFDSQSMDWGKVGGRWSAIRLETGAILDEYRVLGDTGQTWYVTHTLRSYNAVTDRWDLVGIDKGTGLASTGHGIRKGNEVHIEQTFTNASGPTRMMRIHYYDITPDSFKWEGALSKDGGKTWTPRYLTIEARRTGAARKVEGMTTR